MHVYCVKDQAGPRQESDEEVLFGELDSPSSPAEIQQRPSLHRLVLLCVCAVAWVAYFVCLRALSFVCIACDYVEAQATITGWQSLLCCT